MNQIMSFDKEQWYQGGFIRKGIGIKLHPNVINSLKDIIEMFDTFSKKATFFIVSETLLRYAKSGELIL